MKYRHVWSRLAVVLALALIVAGLVLVSMLAQEVGAIPDLARTQHDVIVNYVPETYALTGTKTITPARSLYILAPVDTLTATLGTGNALAGDEVIFINTVATSTIFSDAGDMIAARTLDEDGDSIGFRYDGTEWVEQFFIDQSNAVSGGAGSFTSLSVNGGLTDIGGGSYATADGDNDLGIAGDLEVDKDTDLDGDLDVAGNGDVVGTLNFGSDNLYPLGYASSGYEIVCGTSSTFTGSTTITATGLSTATYVLATQVTAPITTAAFLHVSDPTTTTITLTSLNNTFGAGTTGVQAHYCVVGNQ